MALGGGGVGSLAAGTVAAAAPDVPLPPNAALAAGLPGSCLTLGVANGEPLGAGAAKVSCCCTACTLFDCADDVGGIDPLGGTVDDDLDAILAGSPNRIAK